MTEKKRKRRSPIGSVVAIMICFSLLLGTTFAWFTDQVNSVENVIQAGNLDVELYHTGAFGQEEKVETATKLFLDKDGNEIKWEPGVVAWENLTVKNIGTLALKYDLGVLFKDLNFVEVDGTKHTLSEALSVAVIEDGVTGATRDEVLTKVKNADPAAQWSSLEDFSYTGELNPKSETETEVPSKTYGVVIYWEPGDDDNIWNMNNGKEAEWIVNAADYNLDADNFLRINLGIKLEATQKMYENDSFGPDYDEDAVYADATYTVEEGTTLDSVLTEINSKEDETVLVNLATDVKWETGAEHGSTPWVNDKAYVQNLIVDGNGHTITATGKGVGPIRMANGGTLTIKNAKIVDESVSYAENNWEFGYLEFGGNLVFENVEFVNAAMMSGESAIFRNCTFNSNKDSEYAVWVDNGSAEFYNCTFTGPRGLKTHEAYESEVGTIVVDNCTFDNLTKKPGMAIGTVNAGTTVIIKNSEFINCQPGNQKLYIYETDTDISAFDFKEKDNVVKITATADSSDKLEDAIKNGANTITLDSGNYIIPDSAQGKTITIIGNGDTVIATQDDGSYEGCDYSLDGATVTFENITINTDSTTYTGYARCKGTYNNCVINGTYTLYGDSEFNDCTFNVSGDVYNIWTWGALNATFNNCTFNSDGKAMLLYGTVNTKLTLKDCTFNDNGGLTDLKAAVEIGNDYGKSYELIVNNTTVNGYEINDKGINTGTTLWGNKNSMGTDKLNVVVDGVDVY